jgi:hypothetical protein
VNGLSQLEVPKLERITIDVHPPDGVSLTGTITSHSQASALSGFVKELHTAALHDGLSQLKVDVTGLTFVNSWAVRLFVDWATWLKQAPPTERYGLRFVISRHVAWQKTSFMALVSLAEEVLAVDHAD